MNEAALTATVNLANALAILRSMPYNDATFMRGFRFVTLAHAQERRLGYRSDNVETWVRYGFRILARWSRANGVH